MSTKSFRIQWHDTNDDKDGSLKGRQARHDDWKSLDDFTLSANTTYDFYLSQYQGLSYNAFITLSTAGSGAPQVGAKIPKNFNDDKGSGNDYAVELANIAVGSSPVAVTASYLVSEDPKVQVSWGQSSSNATVSLIWRGSSRGWFQKVNGSEIPVTGTIDVKTNDKVTIEVDDQSQNKSIAAVYEDTGPDTAQIDDVHDLRESNPYPFVRPRPSGSPSVTTYTVNLFDEMSSGSLAVR